MQPIPKERQSEQKGDFWAERELSKRELTVDRARQAALDGIKVENRIRGQTKQGILKSIHDGDSYFLCLNYRLRICLTQACCISFLLLTVMWRTCILVFYGATQNLQWHVIYVKYGITVAASGIENTEALPPLFVCSHRAIAGAFASQGSQVFHQRKRHAQLLKTHNNCAYHPCPLPYPCFPGSVPNFSLSTLKYTLS